VTPEGRAHRPPADDSVVGQVLLRQEPAALAHRPAHGARQRSLVERPRALRGEDLESRREVAHDERLALAKRSPLSVDLAAFVLGSESDVENGVEERLLRQKRDPSPRDIDRGREELLPRHAAEDAVGLAEARDRPRHPTGSTADPEELQCALVERDLDLEHRLGRLLFEAPSGDCDEEIEHAVAPVGGAVHEHEPASPRSRQRAFGDPGDEPGRHAGVHGVPAGLQDPCACFSGQRMAGGDSAPHVLRVTALAARFS
jgi:hypothetical protein